MSVVYRFRITFEDYDEITRDIEIKSTQHFSDFHQTIQSSIGFDQSKPASFYMSNDYWIKGQEIALEKRTDKNGNTALLMEAARLCDFIADPHQKIYYISDYDANWTFRIELIKIIPQADAMRSYPLCVKSVGEAPKQYLVIPTIKTASLESEEFENLMEDSDEEASSNSDEVDDLMGEAVDGVELDEIQGMGEEGEEEEAENEEGEAEYNESDDDSKEDY